MSRLGFSLGNKIVGSLDGRHVTGTHASIRDHLEPHRGQRGSCGASVCAMASSGLRSASLAENMCGAVAGHVEWHILDGCVCVCV